MMRKRINARRIAAVGLGLCLALGLTGISARAGDVFTTTNLVSDGSVPAQFTDPNLVNAWESPTARRVHSGSPITGPA